MIGLPTPRLTAIIDSRGNVRIKGDPLRLGNGTTGRTNQPSKCGACGKTGHVRSNRRCPARRP